LDFYPDAKEFVYDENCPEPKDLDWEKEGKTTPVKN
jgi:hypothetical protein